MRNIEFEESNENIGIQAFGDMSDDDSIAESIEEELDKEDTDVTEDDEDDDDLVSDDDENNDPQHPEDTNR